MPLCSSAMLCSFKGYHTATKNLDNASPVTISASQWKNGTIYDILILYNDRTQEKWKVLNNKIFFNVETKQAFLIEESIDSLRYFYDEKRSTKLIMGNIFILLTHFILWIAKRMPYTERRFSLRQLSMPLPMPSCSCCLEVFHLVSILCTILFMQQLFMAFSHSTPLCKSIIVKGW